MAATTALLAGVKRALHALLLRHVDGTSGPARISTTQAPEAAAPAVAAAAAFEDANGAGAGMRLSGAELTFLDAVCDAIEDADQHTVRIERCVASAPDFAS